MKANTKSIHAKLYTFTYTTDLPNNLCPYFWKLVFATLVFIPNFVIQTPALIWNFFSKTFTDLNEKRGVGFVIYVAITILSFIGFTNYHLIKALFNYYSYDHGAAVNGGIIDSGIAICLIWSLIAYWIRKHRKYSPPKDSVLKEFVKAKYNNYCPKIDWE
ncbi:MAG: hypothetical protein V4721_10520 [Bacteroidota bacterium]